jgi:tRNA threonylcarbamoyl adenosine modification protein (Sua5/YciO/YrdC/YwlC family)
MKRPEIIRIDEADAIRRVAQVLQRGGLAVIPTDTVYGIAAHPANPAAVERLFGAKMRDAGKPVALLVCDSAAIEGYGAHLDETLRRLAARFWPGALTLVLSTPHGTEGFRIPAFEPTLRLLRECGGSLRTSSANLSGAAPALTAGAAVCALGADVDVVLDAGPVSGGVASTVVGLDRGRLLILREGAIPADAVRAAAGADAQTVQPRGA